MTTPDRFEWIAERVGRRRTRIGCSAGYSSIYGAKCIAAYHRAVVRLVKRHPCTIGGNGCNKHDCTIGKADILAALAVWKKEMR